MKFITTKFTSLLCFTFFSLFVSQASFAAEEPVSTGRFNNNAISKHDVLSYHESKQVVKGQKIFVHKWKGANWHFASQEHRDLFAKNPGKYSPAYNGFCSNALSLGKGLVRTNGKIWHIWNDQLHTFYAKGGKQRWLKNDYVKMVVDADREWKKELIKFNK